MVVDFPEPDGPTNAVTVPGLRLERNAVQHGACRRRRRIPRCRRRTSPTMGPMPRRVRSGSSSSGRSRSTSRVRSRPASASLICVPMLTMPMTGAIRKARNAANVDVIAQRQLAREDLARPEIHDERADDAHEHRGRKRHQRHRGEALADVGEQALHARRENFASRSSA